jgi:uncharacterized protein DUF5681
MKKKVNKPARPRGNPGIRQIGASTRFIKGRSGNAGGRPKRTPYADAHREVAELEVRQLRRSRSDSVALGIAKSLARAALKGKISAASECASRVEGPPMQRVEVTEQGPREITLHIVYDKTVKKTREAQREADLIPPDSGRRR